MLARDEVVMDHPPDGEHGQSAVLQFVQLQLVVLPLRLVPQRIEAQISRDAIRINEHGLECDIPLVRAIFLDARREYDLEHGGQSHDGRCHVRIVDVHRQVHGEIVKFANDETDDGKHRHAAVLEFCLAQPLEVEVVGQADGIESHVADHGAVEVRGTKEEGEGLGHFGVQCRHRSPGGGGQRRGRRRREGGDAADEGGEECELHHHCLGGWLGVVRGYLV